MDIITLSEFRKRISWQINEIAVFKITISKIELVGFCNDNAVYLTYHEEDAEFYHIGVNREFYYKIYSCQDVNRQLYIRSENHLKKVILLNLINAKALSESAEKALSWKNRENIKLQCEEKLENSNYITICDAIIEKWQERISSYQTRKKEGLLTLEQKRGASYADYNAL